MKDNHIKSEVDDIKAISSKKTRDDPVLEKQFRYDVKWSVVPHQNSRPFLKQCRSLVY
jgi:hypothetical protein